MGGTSQKMQARIFAPCIAQCYTNTVSKESKYIGFFFYEQFKKVFNFLIFIFQNRDMYIELCQNIFCVCVYIYICIVLHKYSLKTSCCMHDVCVFETVTVFLYDLILDQEMVILLRWPHLRS